MDERRPSFFERPYGYFSSKTTAVLFIGTLLIAFPVALLFWLITTTMSSYADLSHSREEIISPSRWLIACLVPVSFALYGLRRGSVSCSGAVFGLLVGFILALSSYPFIVCLLVFFLSGSQATKFRSDVKKTFEDNFKPAGGRNWIQVLCNCGPATVLAILYILDCGIGELPVDFSESYHASWLAMGVLGTFAAACGDTWSSELGSVVSSQPVLITTMKPVPRGTNGGVSVQGLWFAFLGGLVIGISYLVTMLYSVDRTLLERAPAQWPIILVGGLAGLMGSVIDSYLGAIFQYSGRHKTTGVIVEHAGEDIIHISGREILDNHAVNLLCTISMGLITPSIANSMCRFFRYTSPFFQAYYIYTATNISFEDMTLSHHALGMLGALVLSVRYADAGDNLYTQQTATTVTGTAGVSVNSPNRFTQGLNFVTSGFMNTLGRVPGRLFGSGRGAVASPVVPEVTPSKTMDPLGPGKIETIPLTNVEERPFSVPPKLEQELESKTILVNENELSVDQVIETREPAQTPPVARLSELEEIKNDQLPVRVDDDTVVAEIHSTDLHHYNVNAELIQTEPQPTAYDPSKLDELRTKDDEQVRDKSSPLELIDSSTVQIQEATYNYNTEETPENMKNRPIARLTESDEEGSDIGLVLDNDNAGTMNNARINVTPASADPPSMQYLSGHTEFEDHLSLHEEDATTLTGTADPLPMPYQSLQKEFENHLLLHEEDASTIGGNADPLSMPYLSGHTEIDNHLAFHEEDAPTLSGTADPLPTLYQSLETEFENHLSLHEGGAPTLGSMNYEQESLRYDKSEVFENGVNQPMINPSELRSEEDVKVHDDDDISYNDRSAAFQNIQGPPATYLPENELELDQLLNGKDVIDFDGAVDFIDTSASQKTTSIVDQSKLEILENSMFSTEFGGNVIIGQDSYQSDNDRTFPQSVVVPATDYSGATVDENGAFVSAKVSSVAADQSRMNMVSENVSPEDTFQFTASDVIRLQDENRYNKNGAYTSTEVDLGFSSPSVPLTILPLESKYLENDGLAEDSTLKMSEFETHSSNVGNGNVLGVEEKNIKNAYHNKEELSSSSTRVSGVDYNMGMRNTEGRNLIQANMPQTIKVS